MHFVWGKVTYDGDIVTYDGDIALYRDDDHLTRAGIAKLRKAYRKEIGWVLAGPARAENRP